MNAESVRKLALVGVVVGFGSAAAAGLIALISQQSGPAPLRAGSFQVWARAVPVVSFTEGDATRAVGLGDFAGKAVLLNLWATWCAPCVNELPSLDRLQAELGGADFQVVAVAGDRGGAGVVMPFLSKQGVKALVPYLDPGGALLSAFGVRGLPTSILIGRDGHEAARLLGGADWDSPAVRREIMRLIGRG